MKKVTRRRFLGLGTKFLVFIPMASFIGCMPDHGPKPSPENSLKKLIFLIGPWTIEDRSKAEDFAKRFIKANLIIEQYLPKSAKLIQSLSNRFPTNAWAINDIDLNKIPKEEKELLVVLAKQLYSFVEVRFYVANEPTWGECQGNPNWHTRTPKQLYS